MGNTLWRLARLGRLSTAEGREIIATLASGRPRLFGHAPLAGRALEIADTLDHPIHDCLYVALAEREGGRVVTADRRFLEATVRGGLAERVSWVADV